MIARETQQPTLNDRLKNHISNGKKKNHLENQPAQRFQRGLLHPDICNHTKLKIILVFFSRNKKE